MAHTDEKIRCPKCEWEPDAADRWQCSCGTVWNTFTTYGKCPSCKKVWKDTQCLACWKWSPHADWYVDLQNISLETTIEEKAESYTNIKIEMRNVEALSSSCKSHLIESLG